LIWIKSRRSKAGDDEVAQHEPINSMPANEYSVTAWRADAGGSVARCKDGQIVLDTALAGRADAFNPADLFLAAISACMIKGIERVTPMLKFRLQGVAVRLVDRRQDAPPKMIGVDYELWVETDETDRRLKLLHQNVRKFGTIFNTVLAACPLEGTIHRGVPPWRDAAARDTNSIKGKA
jgi:uncharacterized OsmC-like protein